MNINDAIHISRNPWNYQQGQQREARLICANATNNLEAMRVGVDVPCLRTAAELLHINHPNIAARIHRTIKTLEKINELAFKNNNEATRHATEIEELRNG